MKVQADLELRCPWCTETLKVEATLTFTNYKGSATYQRTMLALKAPTTEHECDGPKADRLQITVNT